MICPTESPLSKVIVLYLQNASVLKRTARNNTLALLTLFRVARGKDRSESIGLNEVDGRLVAEYQEAVRRKYCLQLIDEDGLREARDRAFRSSRSTIRQARSVFARRGDIDWIAFYESRGLTIPPSIAAFMGAKLRGKNLKQNYNVPPDAIIEQTFESIELMRADRDLYLAFWLSVGAGLRKSELRRCKWEHLVIVRDKPRICGGIGKDGFRIDVPMQQRAYESILPFQQPVGFVIEDRGGGELWARRFSSWMRAMGWETRLTMHELRAYAGSLIYQRSPVQAMRFLRHKSIAITEQNYVRYALQSEPIEVL